MLSALRLMRPWDAAGQAPVGAGDDKVGMRREAEGQSSLVTGIFNKALNAAAPASYPSLEA